MCFFLEIHAEVLQQREFGDEKTVPQVTVKGRPADGTGVSLKPPTDFGEYSSFWLWCCLSKQLVVGVLRNIDTTYVGR